MSFQDPAGENLTLTGRPPRVGPQRPQTGEPQQSSRPTGRPPRVGYRPGRAGAGLRLRSGSGSGAPAQVLRTLDGGAPGPVTVAVHEPALDDVFRTLTQGGRSA